MSNITLLYDYIQTCLRERYIIYVLYIFVCKYNMTNRERISAFYPHNINIVCLHTMYDLYKTSRSYIIEVINIYE